MSDDEILTAQAELGEGARRFMESELGKCLLGMARQEMDIAHESLEKADPKDYEQITKLQNQAWRARSFEAWLGELVDSGDEAMAVFMQKLQEQ